jgi:flagellin-like hook-associated protein FlgL
MLGTTADTVDSSAPIIAQITTIMSDTLPSTLEAATSSLKTAQQAAGVMESTIKSLDSFRFLLGSTPFLSGLVDTNATTYSPEVPLADTLGDLAKNLEGLPGTFVSMSTNLSTIDDNMAAIQANLQTMSDSVILISSSLGEYEKMLDQSNTSMDNLKTLLTNLRSNLVVILNGVAVILTLFLLWLLAAQVVIFTQGWELFQGTADRMEGNQE